MARAEQEAQRAERLATNREWKLIQIREAQRCETILGCVRGCWSAAIAAEMEYRANFVLATLTSLGNLAGSLFGLFLFYRTPSRVVVVGSPCGAGHLYRACFPVPSLPPI